MHLVSHDSLVGEWIYLTVCSLRGQGRIWAVAEYFKGFFSGWSHTPGEEMGAFVEKSGLETEGGVANDKVFAQTGNRSRYSGLMVQNAIH